MANTEWGFRTRPTRRMGGKPLARSGIYQIFTKPFYCGRFEYPAGSGQWYQGKHEPMITEAEYDRVQTLLGRKGKPRPQSHHEFAFTGLIHCGECDRMREGHVGGVMGAYNAVYGVPSCASPFLLTDILRKQWGFDGYIVSDCAAIFKP